MHMNPPIKGKGSSLQKRLAISGLLLALSVSTGVTATAFATELDPAVTSRDVAVAAADGYAVMSHRTLWDDEVNLGSGNAEARANGHNVYVSAHLTDRDAPGEKNEGRGIHVRGKVSLGVTSYGGYQTPNSHDNRRRTVTASVRGLARPGTGHNFNAVLCEHRKFRPDKCTSRAYDVL